MIHAALALIASAIASGPAVAGSIELISRAAAFDDTSSGNSGPAVLSADGRYVAYLSNSLNLTPGVTDPSGEFNVYLFDRLVGTTTLVSSSAAHPDQASNGQISSPSISISADGRYVTYQSDATDLVSGQIDSNGGDDIFSFDRMTGSTTLVSHAMSSFVTTGSATSQGTSMSDDGRFVAFQSNATNIAGGSGGGFFWDRTTGAVSSLANPFAAYAVISADGGTILCSNSLNSICAFDRISGTTSIVDHANGSPTTPANATGFDATVSADGRYVAYLSQASNLVPGQIGGGQYDVFFHDRVLDTTVLVSRKAGFSSTVANAASTTCKVSADGNFIVFLSGATDLVAAFVDGNGAGKDLFLYDRVADSLSLVTGQSSSTVAGANGTSNNFYISADGRWVALESHATDLITGQVGGGGVSNAFVYDRLAGVVTLLSHATSSPVVAGDGESFVGPFSADGAFMTLSTLATDLQSGVIDNNGAGDLYVHDMSAGTNTLVSRRAPDLPSISGGGFSLTTNTAGANVISADGRYIAYLSWATNLETGETDSNARQDVFLADRLTRTSVLVSHSSGSVTTAGNAASDSGPLSISADGRWVAFASLATDLVAGVFDTTGHTHVFLYDRLSGANTFVTRSVGSQVAANGDSTGSIVSADGRFVVFTSLATDLVAGQVDANASQDVFLYDRVSDTTVLVSHAAGSATTTANGVSSNAVISQDGGVVAFVSGATNLAGGQSGGFLFERATGLVTNVAFGAANLALSADGNWAAFDSSSFQVPGQTGPPGTINVFLFDRSGGTSTLVSHQAGSPLTSGNSASLQPSLSADGDSVAFGSYATDLVAGIADANSNQDVFLFDRSDGSVHLVSAASGSPPVTANGFSLGFAISADGGRVAFLSTATNLVPGQIAGAGVGNVYLYTRASSSVVLASGAGSSPTTGGNDNVLFQPSLSSDGSVVAYTDASSDLVPGDLNAAWDVFAFMVAYTAPSTSFYPLTPCRAVDTRGPAGPFGGPALAGNATRQFTLIDQCGIPIDAIAVSANVTVVAPTSAGVLSFHPAGFAATQASTLSYAAGQVRANNAILGLGAAGATAVSVSGPGSVPLIVDVNGYFK